MINKNLLINLKLKKIIDLMKEKEDRTMDENIIQRVIDPKTSRDITRNLSIRG